MIHKYIMSFIIEVMNRNRFYYTSAKNEKLKVHITQYINKMQNTCAHVSASGPQLPLLTSSGKKNLRNTCIKCQVINI